jgi:hypothetical protein
VTARVYGYASQLNVDDMIEVAVAAGIPESRARLIFGPGLVLHDSPAVRITLKAVLEWVPSLTGVPVSRKPKDPDKPPPKPKTEPIVHPVDPRKCASCVRWCGRCYFG